MESYEDFGQKNGNKSYLNEYVHVQTYEKKRSKSWVDPLNQGSHTMTVSNNSTKATGPVVANYL